MEPLFISISAIVREVDYRWDQIYPSMMLLYGKLRRFGVTYVDGKIIYDP